MSHNLKVWAPHAKSVALVCHGQHMAMTSLAQGWWSLTSSLIQHGTDYAFLIDDSGPFPDPRSKWQPDGVHGFSRVDCEPFAWTDQGWQAPPFAEAVLYELHVGTFSESGTFDGVLAHLDYLKDLGVSHIELLPVAEFAGDLGWGYDGVQLFAPHHYYGGPAGLRRLVDACHAKGLAVILDVVYNHLGPSGNYLAKFGPYFASHYHTPWGEAVNLDGADSPEVRRFFIDNALMWLRDFHFDGLRLDASHALVDRSATHFLEQLASEVIALEAQLARPLVLIAESHLNDNRVMLEQSAGGYGLNAQWHDDFHHAVHAYLTGERVGYFQDYGQLAHLVKVLNSGVFFDGGYSTYWRRAVGRPPRGLNGHDFIAYVQNHDQVGNRPGGERLNHLLNPGQLKIAAALLLTAPFIPMLFQGEEWAADTPFFFFTQHQEPELARAIKRGRHREALEFGWTVNNVSDPQAERHFLESRLSWSELAVPKHQALWQWYRALIALRRQYSDLRDGTFDSEAAVFDETAQWLCLQRRGFHILFNFAASEQRVPLRGAVGYQCVLASVQTMQWVDDGVVMPGHSVVILQRA